MLDGAPTVHCVHSSCREFVAEDAILGLEILDGGLLLATTDGGKTWQPRKTGTTENLIAIQTIGDSGWLSGYDGVILHSSDGERTWTRQDSGVTQALEGLYFLDAEHGWAVGWAGTVLRTLDGGKTWHAIKTDAASWSLSSVYFRDPKNGWIAGFGMIIAIALNFLLLPACLALLRPRGEPEPIGFRRAAPLDRFLVERRSWVIGAAAVLAALCLALLPRVSFDFDPLNLKDPKSESVATARDLMKDPMTTPYTAEILAPSPSEAEGIADRLAVRGHRECGVAGVRRELQGAADHVLGLCLIEIGRGGSLRRGDGSAGIELSCPPGRQCRGVERGLGVRRDAVDVPEIHREPNHGNEWDEEQAKQHGNVTRTVANETTKCSEQSRPGTG
jgi:hypothetical protein